MKSILSFLVALVLVAAMSVLYGKLYSGDPVTKLIFGEESVANISNSGGDSVVSEVDDVNGLDLSMPELPSIKDMSTEVSTLAA